MSANRELKLYAEEFGSHVPISGAVFSGQIGQLPAPGFTRFFPAKSRQTDGIQGGQTFKHDVVSAYFVVYEYCPDLAEPEPGTQ